MLFQNHLFLNAICWWYFFIHMKGIKVSQDLSKTRLTVQSPNFSCQIMTQMHNYSVQLELIKLHSIKRKKKLSVDLCSYSTQNELLQLTDVITFWVFTSTSMRLESRGRRRCRALLKKLQKFLHYFVSFEPVRACVSRFLQQNKIGAK